MQKYKSKINEMLNQTKKSWSKTKNKKQKKIPWGQEYVASLL